MLSLLTRSKGRGRLFVLLGVMLVVLGGFNIMLQTRPPEGQQVIVSGGDGPDDYRGEGLLHSNHSIPHHSPHLQHPTTNGGPDGEQSRSNHSVPRHSPKLRRPTANSGTGNGGGSGGVGGEVVVRPAPVPDSTLGFLERYVEGVTGGSECEDDYGSAFVKRWQSYGKDYCLPTTSSHITSSSTSPLARLWDESERQQQQHEGFQMETRIRCHSLTPSHQTPEPASVCLAENVVVDFGKLGVTMCQGLGCHNDFYDGDKTVFFKPGVVRGRCRPVVSHDEGWNTNNLVKTVGNWLVRSWVNLEDSEAKSIETNVCTKENTVDHFVYFVSRYDTTNLYHASEDLLHAFMAFSVLNVPVERSQVIIADGLVPGPFLEVWKELYSRNHPLLMVKDLHDNKEVKCYKYMTPNTFAAISPLCKRVGQTTNCGNSTLIRAFRDFFVSSYKMKYLLPSDDKLTITIIQRKNYARADKSEQHVSRQIQNHDDLVAMAKKTLPNAEINSIDFASLSFREQLALIRKTDILVGAHGAALSHMMFLPSTSVVIEFWIDDRFGNYHYVNIGKWLGITHILEEQSNPLRLDETREHLVEAATIVANNKKQRIYDH